MSLDQLRREVVGRSHELSVLGQACRRRSSREAEVAQGGDSRAVQQHVRRLDIAMENSVLVERVEPAADLRGEIDRLLEAQASDLAQARSKRAAGVNREDEVDLAVRLAELEDRHEMAGLDLARQTGLAHEAGTGDRVVVPLRAQNLKHHFRTRLVVRVECDPGCAFSEARTEPVPPDLHAAIISGAR